MHYIYATYNMYTDIIHLRVSMSDQTSTPLQMHASMHASVNVICITAIG